MVGAGRVASQERAIKTSFASSRPFLPYNASAEVPLERVVNRVLKFRVRREELVLTRRVAVQNLSGRDVETGSFGKPHTFVFRECSVRNTLYTSLCRTKARDTAYNVSERSYCYERNNANIPHRDHE